MSCWKWGVEGSIRSRSLCRANSARAFQGGAKACTSTGLRPSGDSWRTGLDAISGMPCIDPKPSLRPSCYGKSKRNEHVNFPFRPSKKKKENKQTNKTRSGRERENPFGSSTGNLRLSGAKLLIDVEGWRNK